MLGDKRRFKWVISTRGSFWGMKKQFLELRQVQAVIRGFKSKEVALSEERERTWGFIRLSPPTRAPSVSLRADAAPPRSQLLASLGKDRSPHITHNSRFISRDRFCQLHGTKRLAVLRQQLIATICKLQPRLVRTTKINERSQDSICYQAFSYNTIIKKILL